MFDRSDRSGWVAILALACLLGWSLPAMADPLVNVKLLADTTAAQPGKPVNLALKFSIPDDHYIFWQHPGEVGQPPTVRWLAPESADFGRLRFPNPEKLLLEGGRRANVLRYEPILLTKLIVPRDAKPGGPLNIRARLDWEVGGSEITKESAELELALRVVSPGQKGEPANAEVFEDASYSQPIPPGKSKYVRLRTELKPSRAEPGGAAQAVFSIAVKRGFHIQAHVPGVEGLIGADLFPVPPEGVTVGGGVFPKGKAREVKYFGMVNEYVGQVKFELPLEFSGEFTGGGPLTGLLLYQACNEKTGVCFPPEFVMWSVNLPLGK